MCYILSMKLKKFLNRVRDWWRIEIDGLEYSRRRRLSLIRYTALKTILSVFVSIAIILSFNVAFDGLRCFLEVIDERILKLNIVTTHFYYSLSILISLIVTAWIFLSLRDTPSRQIVRNRRYILKLFSERGECSPVPTRIKLMDNIYGRTPTKRDKKEFVEISKMIDDNIDPIKTFLSTNNSRVACLNGEWGSGKTTSLLIAIDETKNDNRYIYEAAFKYKNNISEFVNDLLKTLEEVLGEMGVIIDKSINALIDNYDKDFKKMISNYLRMRRNLNILSSEAVLGLNDNYKKSGCGNKIFIIIDDLDRLQANDMVEVLSLCSLLRNLSFVRLILPVDLGIVYKVLKDAKIPDSSKYVEKYIPYASSIRISSGYDMVEKILENKIRHEQKKENWQIDVRPAIVAILIGLLTNEMQVHSKKIDEYTHAWLNGRGVPATVKTNDEKLLRLLHAPELMAKRFDNHNYDWGNARGDIRLFQKIITRMRRRSENNSLMVAIRNQFQIEDYNMIESWCLPYMKNSWELLGLTIRDVLNMLPSLKLKDLPLNLAWQFAFVFNQLFPNDEIHVIENVDDTKKG